MSISTRYFLMEQGTDQLVRVPAARVGRWYDGEERAPEFAGKTVHLLVATCVTDGRRVTSVAEVRPHKVGFLADGRLDLKREMGLATALIEATDDARARPDGVLDLMPRVRRRRLDGKSGFPVSQEQVRAVRDALLGPGRRPS
jgi:hypothetical protein